MLPLDVLGAAIAQGLIQPVPDTVPSGRVDDAYGFARDAAYQGGVDHAWAVPFAVDVAHAIARDEPVPATWEQAIDEGVLFVLPSGEYPGAAALIGSAYLSGDYSGAAQGDGDEGTPGNDGTSGVAAVDAARLSSSITPLANAIAAQVVAAPDAEASTSVRAAWNTFLLREAERAVVSAGVFAPHQAGFPALTWGPIPTGEGKGPSRPIGWGWGLAVTTPDPARAAIAGDLIAHLTEPGDAGWVLGADYLPALATGWPEQVANGIDPAPSTEYIDFVEDLLASAVGVGELPGRWEAWGGVAESLLSGSSAADAAATMSAE
jgi:ABC-type glycerol-3-phosphate transport system substrate-binding protein